MDFKMLKYKRADFADTAEAMQNISARSVLYARKKDGTQIPIRARLIDI